MSRLTALFLAGFFLLVGGLFSPAPGQAPDRRGVTLRVMTSEPNYFSESDLEVYFRADRNVWLYVFLAEPDGVVRQIYPNRYEKDNRVPANTTGRIPSGGYRLLVEGPPGRAEVFAIAVTEKLPVMQTEYGSDQLFREPYPRVYTQPRDVYNTMVSMARGTEASGPVYWGWASYSFTIQPHPAGYQQPYYSAEARLTPPPAPPVTNNQSWREEFRARGRARIRITSKPDGADIHINNRFFGETPQTINLDAGTHDVRVEKKRYETWDREVELVAGTQRTFNITLQRQKNTGSRTSRPKGTPIR